MVVNVGLYAIGHGGLAAAAGLLARSISTGATAGELSLSLETICLIGLGGAVVKAGAGTWLAALHADARGIIGARLRSETVRTLLGSGPHDAGPRVVATIAVRLREIEDQGVTGVLQSLRAAAQCVPIAVTLIALSPLLALGAFVALLPFGAVLARVRRRLRGRSEQQQTAAERIHAGVDELLRNLDVFRTYGAGERVAASIRADERTAISAARRFDATRAGLSGLNEVLGALALLGMIAVARQAGVSLGDGRVVAFAAVFFMAYRPLRDLGDARAMTTRGEVALSRLGLLVPSAGASSTPPIPHRERRPAALELRDFGHAQRGPRLTLTVAPGECVALVGRTGAGKTTLLRALLGLEPAAGKAVYADRDIGAVQAGPARPFAWVPQDAPLVTGNLLENVALRGESLDRARDALRVVGGQQLVEHRSDEILGPSGTPLSGGERRLVGLARALITDQPIVLLDEPTAGLDGEAERAVLAAIQRVKGERSVLIVSHKVDVRAVADRVVTIQEADA